MTAQNDAATEAAAPRISFEFFPPKSEPGAAALEATARRLARLAPEFVSVTYGAGGSSQERSIGTVARIAQTGLATAAHITCAGATQAEVEESIARFRSLGITRFVAIRGDPPGGDNSAYAPHPGGFSDTADLVAALKRAGAEEISVSAYPEKHPQSADWDADIDVLKRKVDAGADRAITQFFFGNDDFEAYLERVRKAGINIPVVPGILPIHRFAGACEFAARCGAAIPDWLAARFEGIDPESERHGEIAVAVASEQIADLARRGVDEFHIYTLNRAELTEAVCRACGILPDRRRAAA